MMTLSRIVSASVILVAVAGCQRPTSAPPPVLTSAVLPAAPPPPAANVGHVYRLDFELTPKDPREPSLVPTTFTLNIAADHAGEVMVGKNVPLNSINLPAAPGSKLPAPIAVAASPRQDVGLRVKARPRTIPNSEDMLIDIDLELSSAEAPSTDPGTQASTIRKVVTDGTSVATPGKTTLVASVDDEKKHYDLTVKLSKLR